MLIHQVTGPTADGRFLVTYPTPGLFVPTVACDCSTRSQADDEAARLDREQLLRERAIRNDRQLRGLGGVYHGLDDQNAPLATGPALNPAGCYSVIS